MITAHIAYGQQPILADSANQSEQETIAIPISPLESSLLKERRMLGSKLMLLEKPGHKRIVYGSGSPIKFSFEDGDKVEGYITRVEPAAFFVQTRAGAELALGYKEVGKLYVPKTGNNVAFRRIAGGALMAGAAGYMLLYAINPGAGNSIDPSKSSHAQTSWIVSALAATAGLGLVYSTRDNRIRVNSGWKWRVDESDPYYLPQLQR